MEQIKNRFTGEIMCGGRSLKLVIEKHGKWLNGEKDGERANLMGAVLMGADLTRANLRDADLMGADLRGLPSCLKIENIHQKVYAAASKDGALDMGDWHNGDNFCGTTHCRAGWVTHLAGEAGQVLECIYGTSTAAVLIYYMSDPELEKVPNFYCDDETALEDMRILAEKEMREATND